jgi:delta-aminolevulinic acid dehydratase/porphobilinogen synthase
VLTPSGAVDNDATIEIYAQMAVLHAEAGVHMVGPSGMMDGQVGAIREALDAAGALAVAILAYSVKYASAFYGPGRRRIIAHGQSQDVPARSSQYPRGAPRGGARRRTGCRHRHGEAGARLFRCGTGRP